MNKRIKQLLGPVVIAATLLLAAPITQAADDMAPPTGAAYLVAGGSTSNINGAEGNGIPGMRSALDVPEPSSWAALGFGIALIGAMAAVRRKQSADS